MTNEEIEKTMQFILEQQAQFTSNFQKIGEARERDSARITQLEESFRLLVQLARNHDERLVSLAEAQIRTSEQLAETDERLNSLIAVVERYITSKGQNGSSRG